MVTRRHCDRGGPDIHPGADQLLNGTESAAVELFCDGVGPRGVFIDHADQLNSFQFTGELVVDAGVISSESAYADDGDRGGIGGGQLDLRKGFQV